VHALRSHMSCLNFRRKHSFDCADDDLSDDAFVWASKHIGGRDVVEEIIACNVWPLAVGISFEQVKVGVTPVSKLKVPLPRFAVARKDDEDDAKILARVKKEARVLVGSYTCPEHEACTVLLNNGHMNRVLELTRVSYGPVKTSTVPVQIGVKQPSDANVASSKSAKLSKKTIPHVIASAAAAHGTLLAFGSKTAPGASNLVATGDHPRSKTIGGTSSSKTVGDVLVSKGAAGSKKAVTPTKKRRVPPTGPLAGASSKENQDSSLCGTMIRSVVPKIPLRLEPHSQSPPASVLGPNPPAALQTTTPFGAGVGLGPSTEASGIRLCC
jgi:hypothetical protein